MKLQTGYKEYSTIQVYAMSISFTKTNEQRKVFTLKEKIKLPRVSSNRRIEKNNFFLPEKINSEI